MGWGVGEEELGDILLVASLCNFIAEPSDMQSLTRSANGALLLVVTIANLYIYHLLIWLLLTF